MIELLMALAMLLGFGVFTYFIKRWWDLRERLAVMDSVPIREWKQRA